MKEVPINGERDLNHLFAAYKDALPEVQPSAQFMPQLWDRIDGQQSWRSQLWRWANSLAAAAAMASLFMAMLQMLPRTSPSFYAATYLETLANQHDTDDVLSALALTSRAVNQETVKR